MSINLEPNVGTIGDVKYSVLPPDKFKKLNGNGWRLMNGEPIEGTALYELTDKKMTHLPNANNRFIRSLDPKDTTRKVGEPQDDTTRLPRTAQFTGHTSTNGNHNHVISTAGIWRRSFEGEDGRPRTAHEKSGHTSTNGNHNHTVAINSGGDAETRPKNIALYTYIKVN